MTNFNITRFLHVLRWEYILGRRSWLIGMLIAFTIYFLICVPQFFYNGNYVITLGQGIFWPLLFWALFGGTFFYSALKTKQQRTNFLMLPASNLEKFATRWLVNLLWFTLMMLGGFVAADLLQYAISMLTGLGQKTCFSLEAIHILSSVIESWSDLFAVVVSIAWCHSLYLLGAQLFRKNHWLLTTLSLIVMALVFAGITAGSLYIIIDKIIDDTVYISYNIDWVNNSFVSTTLYLLQLGFTVFNVWLSYRLFCRKQLINNRFFNI